MCVVGLRYLNVKSVLTLDILGRYLPLNQSTRKLFEINQQMERLAIFQRRFRFDRTLLTIVDASIVQISISSCRERGKVALIERQNDEFHLIQVRVRDQSSV